jgi:hypothetical protein
MGWYRPGRDPNHPGDAPPKWAPLSRTTRFALLFTVIAGVVIALMVISTRPAGAMDAADPPAAGYVLYASPDGVDPLSVPR